jgi:cytochrome c oxidase subunit IV
LRTLSDEVRLFARMSIFGLVVGGAYGLLTGERAGMVLLIAFGLASGLAALAVFLGSGRGRRREAPPAASDADAGAIGVAGEPEAIEQLPEPGWAPLVVAAGIGVLALGGPYGPWLTVAGLLIAIAGGWAWLSAEMRAAGAARGRPPRA